MSKSLEILNSNEKLTDEHRLAALLLLDVSNIDEKQLDEALQRIGDTFVRRLLVSKSAYAKLAVNLLAYVPDSTLSAHSAWSDDTMLGALLDALPNALAGDVEDLHTAAIGTRALWSIRGSSQQWHADLHARCLDVCTQLLRTLCDAENKQFGDADNDVPSANDTNSNASKTSEERSQQSVSPNATSHFILSTTLAIVQRTLMLPNADLTMVSQRKLIERCSSLLSTRTDQLALDALEPLLLLLPMNASASLAAAAAASAPSMSTDDDTAPTTLHNALTTLLAHRLDDETRTKALLVVARATARWGLPWLVGARDEPLFDLTLHLTAIDVRLMLDRSEPLQRYEAAAFDAFCQLHASAMLFIAQSAERIMDANDSLSLDEVAAKMNMSSRALLNARSVFAQLVETLVNAIVDGDAYDRGERSPLAEPLDETAPLPMDDDSGSKKADGAPHRSIDESVGRAFDKGRVVVLRDTDRLCAAVACIGNYYMEESGDADDGARRRLCVVAPALARAFARSDRALGLFLAPLMHFAQNDADLRDAFALAGCVDSVARLLIRLFEDDSGDLDAVHMYIMAASTFTRLTASHLNDDSLRQKTIDASLSFLANSELTDTLVFITVARLLLKLVCTSSPSTLSSALFDTVHRLVASIGTSDSAFLDSSTFATFLDEFNEHLTSTRPSSDASMRSQWLARLDALGDAYVELRDNVEFNQCLSSLST